jgi:LuxR family quorum-sensing system transcriptional regulator SinR
MPGLLGFDALLDELARTPPSAPHTFLDALKREYALGHVLYADLERTAEGGWRGQLLHAPHAALERLLATRGLAALDGLFRHAGDRHGPGFIDPGTLSKANPALASPLAECNLDRPMLVIPLVPSRQGIAFLGCTPGAVQGWRRPLRTLLTELNALAGLFHGACLNEPVAPALQAGHSAAAIHLTPREREVLQWVAAGKSYWEIGRILGISERTVRYFMACCREKLDSVSNKQAVAKAVSAMLIEVGEYPWKPTG